MWNWLRNLGGVTISDRGGPHDFFVLGATLIGIFSRQAIAELLPAISSSSAALLFVALPFSYIIRFPGIDGYGRQLALFTLCLVWAGDMLAYSVVGKFAGRIPCCASAEPEEDLGRCGGKSCGFVDRCGVLRAMDEGGNHSAAGNRNLRQHRGPTRRPDRVRLQTRRRHQRFRDHSPRARWNARSPRQFDPGGAGGMVDFGLAATQVSFLMRKISILGSTGSIGRQTLDVVSSRSDQLAVVALAAGGSHRSCSPRRP